MILPEFQCLCFRTIYDVLNKNVNHCFNLLLYKNLVQLMPTNYLTFPFELLCVVFKK